MFQHLRHTTAAPHGWCLQWNWDLIVPMVLADALIAVAYFCIPLGLFLFLRVWGYAPRHPLIRRLIVAFTIFILTCGLTHVMDVLVIWWPLYRLNVAVRVACATASVVTAIYLWPALLLFVEATRADHR